MKIICCMTLAAALLAAPAWAQTAPAPKPAEPQATGQSAEPQAKPRRTREPCPPVTGSRLTQTRGPNGECQADPFGGRTYTDEDLKRTGATDLGEALRKLDPGIR